MTDEFDRKWRQLMEQLPIIKTIYALIGLTRLGQHPATVAQLAAVLDRPGEEAIDMAWEAARVRPEKGLIHLAAPFGGGGPARRKVYVGDREIPVSGCGPDLFPAAAVLDIGFRAEDTCPVTGTPIRIEFTPSGIQHVEPPEAVVAMVAPDIVGEYGDADIERINMELCSQQPFFASPEAAKQWLATHPGGRVFPVEEMEQRPFFTYIRDHWRPKILAHASEPNNGSANQRQ